MTIPILWNSGRRWWASSVNSRIGTASTCQSFLQMVRLRLSSVAKRQTTLNMLVESVCFPGLHQQGPVEASTCNLSGVEAGESISFLRVAFVDNDMIASKAGQSIDSLPCGALFLRAGRT